MGKSFLGRGWSFPPTFKKDHGIVMVANDEDIAESLQILMSTSLGERVMLPEYGSDLITFLFEPISVSRNFLIRELITTAIVKFEPRIELNVVEVDQSQFQDGIIKIVVSYTVRTNNTRFNLVFPYYKEEGTGIPQLYTDEQLISKEQ